METTVIDGAAVVTVDPARREFTGHVVAQGNRILAVGPGPAPAYDGARVIDGRGCLVTPGFVNTHQHLYQWVTRGLAVDATLFEWLTTLYPVWARILGRDADLGSLEVGKLADLALWNLTTPPHAGIPDPVAALVLSTPPPLTLLLVNGHPVIDHDTVVTVDERMLATAVAKTQHQLLADPKVRLTPPDSRRAASASGCGARTGCGGCGHGISCPRSPREVR